MNKKADCAEYLLDCFIRKSRNRGKDMGILKFLNLLFLTTGFSCNENETGLLDIFNDFRFSPAGLIEKDIREYILHDLLKKYKLTNCSYIIKDKDMKFDDIDLQVRKLISDSVDNLVFKNPAIIDLQVFDIVDIIQRWSCWKICKYCAERTFSKNLVCPKKLIRKSVKYFTVGSNTFISFINKY